jgi:bifunctional DNase/RNase
MVIFQETRGKRKIAMRIGTFETDSILMALENIKPDRPLIHDLFYNLAKAIKLSFEEVILYKFRDGIFHSKIIMAYNNHHLEITARACDAIALALRFNSPVYAYESVLDAAALPERYSATKKEKEIKPADSKMLGEHNLVLLDNEELKKMLKQAVDTENYELAGFIRDELLKRNGQSE